MNAHTLNDLGEVVKTAACGLLVSLKPSVAFYSIVLLHAQVAAVPLSSLLGFILMCLCKHQWLSSPSGFLLALLVASLINWLQAQVAVDLSCKPKWFSCLNMVSKTNWMCKVFVLFHTCNFCVMFKYEKDYNNFF